LSGGDGQRLGGCSNRVWPNSTGWRPPAGLSSRRSVGLVRAATRHPPVGRSDLL